MVHTVNSQGISSLEGQNTLAKNDLRDQNKHFCKFDEKEHVRLRERDLEEFISPI